MKRTPSQVVAAMSWVLLLVVAPPAGAVPSALTFVVAQRGGGGAEGLGETGSVAVSPDGTHVYFASKGDNALAVFSRDAGTGYLAFIEAHFDGVNGVDKLREAFSVAVTPDGAHVYVVGRLDDSLAVFSRDAGTGRFAFVEVLRDGVGGVDGLDSPRDVAISPDGANLYVASPYRRRGRDLRAGCGQQDPHIH